jgi:(2R)-sulfolactate sulfo-lyase subunit beta
MSIVSRDTTLLGYRRENGRIGVRNHVIVLPLDDLSNAAAEAVAHNVEDTLAIPHACGRLQFGADLELHFRTLIGTGCNPNVAALVVIGIEGHGDHDTIRRTSKAARECVRWASEKQREACPIHALGASAKCGESDTTSSCGARSRSTRPGTSCSSACCALHTGG